MSYVDEFAGFIVGCLPTTWQVNVNPANVAILLWVLIWAVFMVVFFLSVFNLLAKKETIPEVNHNTSFD